MSTTTTTDSGPAAGAVFDAGETIAHGAVHLDVTDLPRALAFWRDLLGLTDLGGADGVARRGAGGRELIVLHAGAIRGPQRGHSGLYHVALHLLAAIRERLGAAGADLEAEVDALFVRDPAGNRLRLVVWAKLARISGPVRSRRGAGVVERDSLE